MRKPTRPLRYHRGSGSDRAKVRRAPSPMTSDSGTDRHLLDSHGTAIGHVTVADAALAFGRLQPTVLLQREGQPEASASRTQSVERTGPPHEADREDGAG
jgi:hypothetical protein